MLVSVLFSRRQAIKGGTVKWDRNWPQKYVQGDIRFADVLEKMGAN
ncbi:hypothetical protein KCP74_21655 [Salmonella enterica subsp. enterica]|nr:hypothetical protein KCP74_21655 [Salmonella enterica subsp. enterica]